MVALAFLFLILAIIFGIWAFAATAVWVGAKILFWIFVVLFVISLVGGFFRGPRPLPPG